MSPPLDRLLEVLAHHRRAGAPFEDAWAPAVLCVVAEIRDVEEAAMWRRAFTQTAAAWQASYERAPASRRERALSLVADPVDRERIATTRVCAHCAGPLPIDAAMNARHCSKKCRDRASNLRRGAVKNTRRRELRLRVAA
jgi:hypothetical protein